MTGPCRPPHHYSAKSVKFWLRFGDGRRRAPSRRAGFNSFETAVLWPLYHRPVLPRTAVSTAAFGQVPRSVDWTGQAVSGRPDRGSGAGSIPESLGDPATGSVSNLLKLGDDASAADGTISWRGIVRSATQPLGRGPRGGTVL